MADLKGETPSANAAHEGGNAHSSGAGKNRASVKPPGSAKALIGTTIADRYRIEKLLGEGGMGAVYQAEHTLMRKRMAIKVLHPEMIRLPEVVQRFENEAIAAAHIDSPHVVTATDFGKLQDGSFYLALEFIEGKSLREVLAHGPLELGRALHVGRQIATALSRAHALKIVHRDLKPENVMLVERDGDASFVKVLDFGIAKVSLGEVIGEAHAAGPGQPVLTQAGMVYGTPEYMAPEQALGQPVDARADLYALGIMLYEMLTGRRPFEADSKVALLGMQVTAPVPPMAQKNPNANVPPEVEGLVLRLLAKEASERLGEARELIEGINAALVALAAAGRIDGAYAPPPTSTQLSNPGIVTGPSPVLPQPSRPDAGPVSGPGATSAAKKIEGLLPGKTWMIAAGAGTMGLIVLVAAIVIVLRGREAQGEGGADADVVARSDADTASTPTPSLPPDATVAEAIAMIERGDYGSGIKKLEGLEGPAAAREDVHRALLTAYGATDRDKDAMREAALVLKGLPQGADLAAEKKLRTEVRNTAVKTGSKDPETQGAADDAFRLLENEMGTQGWSTLWELGFGSAGEPYPEARKRAKAAFAKAGAKTKMGPANAVTYDLFLVGKSCAARPLFERAAQDGDDRTLDLLKQLEAPIYVKSGWKTRDALGCVHEGSLKKTIQQLQENLALKKK